MRILNPALRSETSEPVLPVPGYPTSIMRSAGLRSRFAAFVISLNHSIFKVSFKECCQRCRHALDLLSRRTVTKHLAYSRKQGPRDDVVVFKTALLKLIAKSVNLFEHIANRDFIRNVVHVVG